MPTLAGLRILALGLTFTSLAMAAPTGSPSPRPVVNEITPLAATATSVESLEREIRIAKDSIESIRRDQLNYRVERDILKEVYSSNLETINLVITIILGIFAILGFLGVRSISALRDDFRRELEKLESLRGRFEQKFLEVEQEQEQARTRFTELIKVNQEQDRRLQILEVQEKVSGLVNQRSYARALEYVVVGLELSPRDLILLRYRVVCFTGVGRMDDAIDAAKKLLQVEPHDDATLSNLSELYLLTDNAKEFGELFGQYKKRLISRSGPYLEPYFEALRSFLAGDEARLRQVVIGALKEAGSESVSRIRGWTYDEAREAISAKSESPAKVLMLAFLEFLEGKRDASQLKELAKSAKS